LNRVRDLFGFAAWMAGLFEISMTWWAERLQLDRQSRIQSS
jgi:hypothetical protein